MLILTGVDVEVTDAGIRRMLCFESSRSPGVFYKVEADAGTVERLRMVIDQEEQTAVHFTIEFEDEDEDV